MKIGRFVFAFGLLGAVSAARAGFIYDAGDFINALNGASHLEDFSLITSGYQASFSSSGSGFSWSATAIGGIKGITGAMSTIDPRRAITFDLSSSPTAVTAFGGVFSVTNNSGGPLSGFVTLSLSNGGTVTSNTLTGPAFIGWVSDSLNPGVLTGATFTPSTSSNVGDDYYATVDDLRVGRSLNPVPEPFTMGIGFAGALAFVRRRCKERGSTAS